jgi:hypothetical protein
VNDSDGNRHAALAEKLSHLERMDANLRYTHGKVLAWWRDEGPFSALSADQLESLSAFKSRFAELQDHLGSAMRLIAEIENEDTRLFTYVINYMEQLEILPSMDSWIEARDLRNKATHDYSAPDEDKLRHFSALLACTPDLYRTYASLKEFVEHHYLNRNKKP